MASMTVKIAVDNTDAIKDAANNAVMVALERIGLLAEGYAIKKCPHDTGRLRASISHGVIAEEKCAYIGTNVEYAAYVEYGTKKMKARPYFKPAVNDHQSEYKAIYEECLRNA